MCIRDSYAILEVDGTLNSILYAAEQTVTPKTMNLTVQDPGLPVTLISDGRIIQDNLRMIGKNEKWLINQLKRHGASSADEVYLMTVDALDGIYYCPMEVKK